MAVAKSSLSIRAARTTCLASCLESNAPFTCLQEFEEQLRIMGWGEDDIEAVRMEVLPLIIEHFNGELSKSDGEDYMHFPGLA